MEVQQLAAMHAVKGSALGLLCMLLCMVHDACWCAWCLMHAGVHACLHACVHGACRYSSWQAVSPLELFDAPVEKAVPAVSGSEGVWGSGFEVWR